MTNEEWRKFFSICAQVLGKGNEFAPQSESWCGWTVFSRVGSDFHYWSSGMPNQDELAETCVKHQSAWGQPFSYQDLAHIVIPRHFYWETKGGKDFQHGTKRQDIDRLSEKLAEAGITHRKTDLVLEIKLY